MIDNVSSDIVSIELGEFFDYMWHDTQAYVYLPVHKAPFGPQDWVVVMYTWPRQRSAVIRHVLKYTIDNNVFYSPAMYKFARPLKENVLGTWVLWVDFDGNAPKSWDNIKVPKPTLRVQSSIARHEHCYWQLGEFLTDIRIIDDRNRALAYTLKADTSGWDADQILRPIHTMNHKRNKPVTIKEGPL